MELHPLLYAVAAAAAVWLLFSALRLLRLMAGPRKGSVLDRMEGTVRLRDLFRLAVEIEDEGVAFYRGLAERARNEAVRKFCERLAAEEYAHGELFRRQLGGWRRLPSNKLLLRTLLEQAVRQGIFSRAPGPDASEEEMIAYAVEQEKKTAEFYRAFEKAFPETWKRAHMRELVEEEERHARDLLTSYPAFKDGRWTA